MKITPKEKHISEYLNEKQRYEFPHHHVFKLDGRKFKVVIGMECKICFFNKKSNCNIMECSGNFRKDKLYVIFRRI